MNSEKNITIWTMIRRIFPKMISVSPVLVILNYILFALNGVFIAASIFGMQILFEKVTDLSNHKANMQTAIFALLFLFFIKIVEELTDGFANFIAETYDPKVRAKLTNDINLKIGKIDPVHFENNKILDDIQKSYSAINFCINFINTIMDVLLFYLPYFIFIGVYLFSLDPILLLSLIAIFLPVFITQRIRAKIFSKLEDQTAPISRKAKHYEDCLSNKEYIKETRILGVCTYFMKLLEDALVELNHIRWKANIKINLIELVTKVITICGYIFILWLLVDSLLKGKISTGAFAAIFASVDKMFSMMEQVICGRLGYYANNFGKIKNYLKFLDMEERELYINQGCEIKNRRIVLRNVNFSYPNTYKNSINNVNLTINHGEKIAIVGANGSGKSTLIKLITGIYLPQRGRIYHNKNQTDKVSMDVLFNGISCIFQNFQKYKLSLYDNIVISDIKSKYRSLKDIENIFKKLNLDIGSFPQGYETLLSKEFGGIELSGGQWQKIAIARGLYKKHELIILDEPTSSIDPFEENKIYEIFKDMCIDKTAIIITHRLASVKFVDRIIVMDNGRIEAIGNHKELLLNCELYKNMWDSQSQFYSS